MDSDQAIEKFNQVFKDGKCFISPSTDKKLVANSIIVRDLSIAEYLTDAEDEPEGKEIPEHGNWNSLKENYLLTTPTTTDEHSKILREAYYDFEEVLMEHLPAMDAMGIHLDQRIVFKHIINEEPADSLGAKIQATYEAGGIPCGYTTDEIETGNLIVYWPHDRKPNFD